MSTLEEKYGEAQSNIDELTTERNQRQKRAQRTWSVPTLPADADSDGLTSCTRFDQQIIENEEQRRRSDHIRQLKLQLHTEKTRRCDLEKELGILVQENQTLAADRGVYETQGQRVLQLERELETALLNMEQLCRRKTTDNPDDESGELLEHDLNDLRDIPHGELLRLKNGGSAYGSRESLNLIGLETEDGIGEVCSFIVGSKRSSDSPSSPSNDDSSEAGIKTVDSVSILGELEEQYRKLVKKYESVIEVKNQARSSHDVDTETNTEPTAAAKPSELAVESTAQTSYWNLDLRSPIDPTDHHFENGPPEYKRLFKEIFDTLRRSIVYEDGRVVHSGQPAAGSHAGPHADSSSAQKG